jgi:16S rRNA (guanine527-N7)-methyltransferase
LIGPPDEGDLLRSGAEFLGVRLGAREVALLLTYIDLLYDWNRSTALTSIPRASAVRLHLVDSLFAAPLLSGVGAIADLGAGGGLPGIPISVAMPDTVVSLVESRRRKCSFLEFACRELALRNCRVIHADARRLASNPCRYDAVISRAFLSPARLVRLGQKLVRPGGRILIMGARNDRELDAAGRSTGLVAVADARTELLGGTERRRIVVYQRPMGTQREER